jgi:hypothetical protein
MIEEVCIARDRSALAIGAAGGADWYGTGQATWQALADVYFMRRLT